VAELDANTDSLDMYGKQTGKTVIYGRSNRYGIRGLHSFTEEVLTQRLQLEKNRTCVEFTSPFSATTRSEGIGRIAMEDSGTMLV